MIIWYYIYTYIIIYILYFYVYIYTLMIHKMKRSQIRAPWGVVFLSHWIACVLAAVQDLWALRPGCFSRISVCSLHLAFHQLSHGGGGGSWTCWASPWNGEWRMDILDVGRTIRKAWQEKTGKHYCCKVRFMNLYPSHYSLSIHLDATDTNSTVELFDTRSPTVQWRVHLLRPSVGQQCFDVGFCVSDRFWGMTELSIRYKI